MFNKKWHFSWGMARPFSKSGVSQISYSFFRSLICFVCLCESALQPVSIKSHFVDKIQVIHKKSYKQKVYSVGLNKQLTMRITMTSTPKDTNLSMIYTFPLALAASAALWLEEDMGMLCC
jgi:hypothetical protein